MFTKFLDEYEVGERWVSRGRTITEADLVNFAAFSGDWFPLHADRSYAEKTHYGQRIAHGLLVLSAASGLFEFGTDAVVAFYGMEKVRFTNPTFIGDTIHVELEITDLRETGEDRGVVTAEQRVAKQTGEHAAIATLRLVVSRGPEREEVYLK